MATNRADSVAPSIHLYINDYHFALHFITDSLLSSVGNQSNMKTVHWVWGLLALQRTVGLFRQDAHCDIDSYTLPSIS